MKANRNLSAHIWRDYPLFVLAIFLSRVFHLYNSQSYPPYLLKHAGLDDGPFVIVTTMQDIEAYWKNHRGSIQQASPVHRLGCRIHGHGPKREEHGDEGPDQSKCVGWDPKYTKLPRPVVDLVAAKTFPEDESDRREVRAQEAGDHKGDEGIESFGGADVDEGEQKGNDGCHTNGNERKFGARVDLSYRSAECTSMNHPKGRLTWPRNLGNGRPLSRAKAHNILEAAARTAVEQKMVKNNINDVIPVAPPLPVAWAKISMNGNLVGVARASSIFPMQNRTARSIANPRVPFTTILTIRLLGTMVEAPFISSHMWIAPSAPDAKLANMK